MPEINLSEEREKLRQLYRDNPRTKKGRILAVGMKGCGKTSLLKTCPKPVLVHSFDAGGTEVLQDEIEKGSIIADTRYELDTVQNPRAYISWEQEINRLHSIKFFNEIGTYCIDSFTMFVTRTIWQIMKKEGRVPPGMSSPVDLNKHGMRINDWQTVINICLMTVNSLANLPCHVILTGHLAYDKDMVTGSFQKMFNIPGQSSEYVPYNMPEVWMVKRDPHNDRVRIWTRGWDQGFEPSTKMGAGKFEKEEEPDVRALLKKAGYSYEDVESK